MPDSRTATFFDAMLAQQAEEREYARDYRRSEIERAERKGNYVTGDLIHRELGDIEINCPECHGEGRIEAEVSGSPWRVVRRECECCKGSGKIWQEVTG